MNAIIFYLFLSLFSNTFAENIEVKVFSQNAQEKRYRALIDEIRCPVCQGQSIAGSNADLAKDLREQVRNMILNNNSNAQIRQFMVARYGDFVVFTPPVNQKTYLLWFAPFIFVALGLWFLVSTLKRKKNPTTKVDTAKARELLK